MARATHTLLATGAASTRRSGDCRASFMRWRLSASVGVIAALPVPPRPAAYAPVPAPARPQAFLMDQKAGQIVPLAPGNDGFVLPVNLENGHHRHALKVTGGRPSTRARLRGRQPGSSELLIRTSIL